METLFEILDASKQSSTQIASILIENVVMVQVWNIM